MSLLKRLYLSLTIFLLILPANANAYIDPASGSLVLQLVSGMLVGVLIFFRRIRDVITSVCKALLKPFLKK